MEGPSSQLCRYNKNGIQVLHVKSGGGLFHIQIELLTGSADETEPSLYEAAHLLEHLNAHWSSESRRDSGKLLKELESRGIRHNAMVGMYRTVYFMRGPNEHLNFALDVILSALYQFHLDEMILSQEKEAVRQELVLRFSGLGTMVMHTHLKMMYPGHAITKDLKDRIDNVQRLNNQDLLDFRKRFYATENTIISIGTSTDANKFMHLVSEKVSGVMGTRRSHPFPKFKLPDREERLTYFRIKSEARNSFILISFRVPFSYFDDEKYAIEALVTILGDGFSARLFHVLRSVKGLVYSVSVDSHLDPHDKNMSRLDIQTTTASKKTGDVFRAIMHTLKGIVEGGVTEEEMERFRNIALFEFEQILLSRDPARWIQLHTSNIIWGKKYPGIETLREHALSVDKAAINNVANRIFGEQQRAFLTYIGPAIQFEMVPYLSENMALVLQRSGMDAFSVHSLAKSLPKTSVKTIPLGKSLDPTGCIEMRVVSDPKTHKEFAYLFNISHPDKPYCKHVSSQQDLEEWLRNSTEDDYLCPHCGTGEISSKEMSSDIDVLTVGQEMVRVTPPFVGKIETDPEKWFKAYNLTPNRFHGHDPRPQIYGDEPVFEKGEMFFKPKDGSMGLVPTIPQSDLYGVELGKVPTKEAKEFRIHYVIVYPKSFEKMTVEEKSKMLVFCLLHGVPTQGNQKYETARTLGKFGVVIIPDMLGMGESDQIHEYGATNTNAIEGRKDHQKWDWKHDVEWVHKLMTEHVPGEYGTSKKFVFQADDWGAGIAIHYAAAENTSLEMLILVNPIFLDGYYVREIGAIGRASKLAADDPKKFMDLFSAADQTIIQIEKLMIFNRDKMNQYTERDFIGPYADTDYQSGRDAQHMGLNYWNLQTLADRSSRLAPRQLLPFHTGKDGLDWGVHYENIKVPVELIWGMKDQMMPPTQLDRGEYVFRNTHVGITEIDNADHFCEWDRPAAVSRAMLRAVRRELGKNRIPIFLGNEGVMKGDEEDMVEELRKLYKAPSYK